jgi:hypothetical protein
MSIPNLGHERWRTQLIWIKDYSGHWQYGAVNMNRFRRRRLQTRLALLAGVVMLWAQFVLALHPMTSISAMAMTGSAMSMSTPGEHAGCHDTSPPEQSAICKAHCGQGDQSDASGRVPCIPFLPLTSVTPFSWSTTSGPSSEPLSTAVPPVSWHRPTPHPASLLLI